MLFQSVRLYKALSALRTCGKLRSAMLSCHNLDLGGTLVWLIPTKI